MPIYEYRCEACGHYLETLQKISDPPLTDCHKCGKPALKKLVSASAFRLKGGGWYETDFKTGGKKNVVASDSKESSAGNPKASDTTSGTAVKKETAGD
jgi:putative FmdB family regulatory protein